MGTSPKLITRREISTSGPSASPRHSTVSPLPPGVLTSYRSCEKVPLTRGV